MQTDYHGLPALRFGNAHLQIDVLVEAGPRIVRLFLSGSDENQLAETPDVTWQTPYGEYQIFGGHRLWHAPEAFPRSYIPDSTGLKLETVRGGVRLQQQTEVPTGLQKKIEVVVDPEQPRLTVNHTLQNNGAWPVKAAPWAITQLPLGGVAILPQQPGRTTGHAPNRQLNLWPYSEWHDPRLRLHDAFHLVDGHPRMPPLKIGYLNYVGWIGYLRRDHLFVKRFVPQPQERHPDGNSNVEVFCHDQFLELETLAPLHQINPGEQAIHTEHWEWYSADTAAPTVEQIATLVSDLGLP